MEDKEMQDRIKNGIGWVDISQSGSEDRVEILREQIPPFKSYTDRILRITIKANIQEVEIYKTYKYESNKKG